MSKSPTQLTAGCCPTFRRFFRWLFGWRMIRRCLFAVAFLVTLIGLFYGAENWRGARARQAYVEETRNRPGPKTWQEIIPPAVADEKNFAMTPFLAPLFGFVANTGPDKYLVKDTNALARIQEFAEGIPPDVGNLNRWQTGKSFDLAEWLDDLKKRNLPGITVPDTTNAAQVATAVLNALKPYDAVLDELRTAARRPEARFNVRYEEENPWGILLPHLAVLRRASQLLGLRAVAELTLGQTDRALDDLQLMLRMMDSIRREPFLVTQLVRVAMTQLALQVVWEGVEGKRWSAAQLQTIQEGLGQFDFLTDLKRSLDAERVAGNTSIEQLRLAKNRRALLDAFGNVDVGLIGLFPRGWFDQEFVTYNRRYDQLVIPTLDPNSRRIHPQAAEKAQDGIERSASGLLEAVLRHEVMARLLLPAFSDVLVKSANAQANVDLARIALALERYRLAEKVYPETLDALVPRYLASLPRDVITGEPPRYQRHDNNGFVLYSVGWNEKDDGGTVVKPKPKSTAVDLRQGDWVWPVRAKE